MLEHPTLSNKRIIHSKQVGEDLYNMLDKTFTIPQYYKFEVIQVPRGMVGRMDLISKALYDTDKWTDVLCKLNGYGNPFELNEDDMIVCPKYEYLDDFYNYQSDLESEYAVNEDDIPKPKTMKEKRRANEAVVGDTRFKVDSKRRIVIY